MDKLICEATPAGEVYCDENLNRNVNLMNVVKPMNVKRTFNEVILDFMSSASISSHSTASEYYDNIEKV